ncbi:MAG TPA: LuxR C-terminal-related transcriptional regulator [Streptosporangiaceae bacterium]|jgi:predicted ATPase/DNA-binding CsgD family transcriptional regulator
MSQREAEVLEAVGGHLSNAQIASRLHISVRTVESHVSSLLRKFGVADRRALADLAPAVAAIPSARTGTGPVTGLPAARTSFIGRDREQATILAALADRRVVSLVGPGGVGKTRLAARAAEAAAGEYPFGSVFVDLVPVRENFVTQAVAALLGITERPGQSLDAALHEYLSRGRSLLVLDNCEHLLEVVASFVEKLMADCAGLTVLATSRERLAIPGERTVPVRPLSLVGNGSGTAGSEAEALFMDRARACDPGFAASPEVLSEVCTRLDGVPLAIELAAARGASLGADGLLAGLDDYLRLLAGSRGPHERHRSLRAVIDWSHDLLDDDERAMFRRAGAFTGGFDLDAAVAVWPDGNRGMVADLIGRLTDKSLLTRPDPDGSRWQMLETIRAYALDRLAASGEESAVREAHLRWATSVAEDLEERVETSRPWRDDFDPVADDLRAALVNPPGEMSHRLARALGHLTYAYRFMVESREHYEAAAELASSPAEAAADLRTAADVAMASGHRAAAFTLLLDSAEQAGIAGDKFTRAAALAYAATIADRFAEDFPEEIRHDRLRHLVEDAARHCPVDDAVGMAYVKAADAWTAQPEKTVPDPVLSRVALEAARAAGDPVLICGALDAVVVGLDHRGRIREAHQANMERVQLLEQLPRHDPRAGNEIADAFHMVTAIAVTAGDLPDALSFAQMARDDDIASGQPHVAASKLILPLVLQGRFDDAVRQAAIMWEAWRRAGRPPARWLGSAAYGMVLAHGLRGDEAGHAQWLERVGELMGEGTEMVSGTYLAAAADFTEARICLHEGRTEAAVAATAELRPEAESWYDVPHWHSLRPYAWAVAAEVAVVAGLPDAAARLTAAAPAGQENYWAAACLARAAGRLHGDRDALERSVTGWERIDARFERACTLMLLSGRADEGRAELDALGCRPEGRQTAH